MCIAANKFPGVRAAPCHDDLTAEMSRRHNDSNVLCLSADLLGERLIGRMIELWLTTPFEGGRHARRVDKITAIEREIERQDSRQRRRTHAAERTEASGGIESPDSAETDRCRIRRCGFRCISSRRRQCLAVSLGAAVAFVADPRGEKPRRKPFCLMSASWKAATPG